MSYDYRKFSAPSNYLALIEIETYSRTASGKSWKSKPDSIEHHVFRPEQYTNYITAVPVFNNWGNGASCRCSWSYTFAGYLPTSCTTVSPYRETKKVASFRFVNLYTMQRKAGFRENDILSRSHNWEVDFDGRSPVYTFITDPDRDGRQESAQWHTRREEWTN